MKKCLLFLFTITVLLISSASALEIGENVEFAPSQSNTEYVSNATLTFDSVEINETALFFNDGVFMINPDKGNLTVHINQWNANIINYTVNSTDNATTIISKLGGLYAIGSYHVYVDGEFYKTITPEDGIIEFTHSASNHTFLIKSAWKESVKELSNIMIFAVIVVIVIGVIMVVTKKLKEAT